MESLCSAIPALASSGALDGRCWTIIVALATAVAGEAWFIRVLYRNLQRCQDARISAMEDVVALLKTARKEAEEGPSR